LIEDALPRPRLLGEELRVAEDAIDRPSVEGRLDVVEAHGGFIAAAAGPSLIVAALDRRADPTSSSVARFGDIDRSRSGSIAPRFCGPPDSA
jgi:hypothetical protein